MDNNDEEQEGYVGDHGSQQGGPGFQSGAFSLEYACSLHVCVGCEWMSLFISPAMSWWLCHCLPKCISRLLFFLELLLHPVRHPFLSACFWLPGNSSRLKFSQYTANCLRVALALFRRGRGLPPSLSQNHFLIFSLLCYLNPHLECNSKHKDGFSLRGRCSQTSLTPLTVKTFLSFQMCICS